MKKVMTLMEHRDFEIRSFDEETRQVTGIAAPYGQTIDMGGFEERFERGAFDGAEGVRLFYAHKEPIGKVLRGEDTEEGYVITASISKTQRGDEVYVLLKDGVLNRFSVGFMPVEERKEGRTIVRTKVDLKEVSVVAFPAYSEAKVSLVRENNSQDTSAENNTNKEDMIIMSNEENVIDVSDLRDSVEALERRFAVIEDGAHKEDNKVVFRSGGAFLKALAEGDSAAVKEARAYTGATSTDADVTRPGWVNETMRMDLEGRPTINAFSRSPLPATGNTIEYPVVSSTSGTVAAQAAEGDDLAYLEVVLDTATASVGTYGGYSQVSRQAIERSDLAYLETVLEYQVRQYAKATEAVVRGVLTGAAGTNTATLAADTAVGWIDLVVDAAAAIDDNGKGAKAEFAFASRNVFKRLAHMVDGSNRPLFNVSGQAVNALGSSNLLTPSINVAGLTVIVNGDLADNTFIVADSKAVKTWESAGAPFRLRDENIINLSKDFSLYGYLAAGVVNAKGLTVCDVDLV